MNKTSKILCMIAAGMIAFGAALAGFGFLLGADTSIHMGSWNRYFGDYDDIHSDPALMMRQDKELEGFQGIDLDVAYQEVEIREGDSFHISYSYNKEYSKVNFSVDDGVLTVKETKLKEFGRPNWDWLKRKKIGGEMTITYPKGTELDAVTIDSDMTSVSVENLTAQQLTVTAAMGEVELSEIHVTDMNLEADMGSITVDDSSCDTATLVCNMGGIESDNLITRQKLTVSADMGGIGLDGDFRGESMIECKMGGVTMNLAGSRKEYSYDLDASMGGVEVDGDEYNSHAKSDAGENFLGIEADMGGIEVNFR